MMVEGAGLGLSGGGGVEGEGGSTRDAVVVPRSPSSSSGLVVWIWLVLEGLVVVLG